MPVRPVALALAAAVAGGCGLPPGDTGAHVETIMQTNLNPAGFVTVPELGSDRPAAATAFDFLHGSWTVHNSVLRGRLQGSSEWVEWDATLDVVPILGGLGNVDRFRATRQGEYFEGVSVRLFDLVQERWSIYWADSRTGTFTPPVHGRFVGPRGVFYGDEVHEGAPVRVRWIWTYDGAATAAWEQAYSADDGATWEVNWRMSFARR
jgi:hypothetical protein